MKNLTIGVLLAGVLALQACGGEGETITLGEESAPPVLPGGEKNLFSTWTSPDGEDVLYFGTMEFIEWQKIAIIDEPDICICYLQIIGKQSAGNYTFQQCTIFSGDVGACNVLDSTGTYSKTAAELTMQPASGPAQIYR